MALRWIKAVHHRLSSFAPQHDDDDLLLLSAEFVVGRVYRDRSQPQASKFFWSLTGPHGSPTGNRYGMTDTLDSAQAELLASWRRWQEWAGVRDAD
jgi:hypothetical protein